MKKDQYRITKHIKRLKQEVPGVRIDEHKTFLKDLPGLIKNEHIQEATLITSRRLLNPLSPHNLLNITTSLPEIDMAPSLLEQRIQNSYESYEKSIKNEEPFIASTSLNKYQGMIETIAAARYEDKEANSAHENARRNSQRGLNLFIDIARNTEKDVNYIKNIAPFSLNYPKTPLQEYATSDDKLFGVLQFANYVADIVNNHEIRTTPDKRISP